MADDQELAASLADVMNELGDSHGYLTGTAADECNTFWYQVLHGDGVLESDWFAELFGAQYDDPEVQEGVDTLRDLVDLSAQRLREVPQGRGRGPGRGRPLPV